MLHALAHARVLRLHVQDIVGDDSKVKSLLCGVLECIKFESEGYALDNSDTHWQCISNNVFQIHNQFQ